MDVLLNEKVLNHLIWTTKSINIINKIMNHINSTKLMKPIGYIVKYYINKHNSIGTEPSISMADNIKINRDSSILAYVCELFIKRKKPETVIVLSKSIIYKAIGGIISEVISEIFSFKNRPTNYGEIYMLNLLSETLSGEKNDKTRDIIKSAYFVTKYLMEISDTIGLYNMNTLMLHAQDLDLTILDNKMRREIMNIMNTKRTLYLRIFLIIANRMIKEKSVLSGSWCRKKIKIKNMETFKNILSDDIIELIISITGYIISL